MDADARLQDLVDVVVQVTKSDVAVPVAVVVNVNALHVARTVREVLVDPFGDGTLNRRPLRGGVAVGRVRVNRNR